MPAGILNEGTARHCNHLQCLAFFGLRLALENLMECKNISIGIRRCFPN